MTKWSSSFLMDKWTSLLLSKECFVMHTLFTSVHAYIYSGDATYWDIFRLLIGYWLHHGGCDSCTVEILYYNHNILLLLTNQKLEFICGVNNMITLKQMMMHMNWLTQCYTYIRLLGWWDLLSWCMCSDCMGCMSVCQPIWLSYDSSISCPNNAVMVFVFVINGPAHWYPVFPDFLFITFFTFSFIIFSFFVWHWMFMHNVVPVWSIVYVIVIIACDWLFIKLC